MKNIYHFILVLILLGSCHLTRTSPEMARDMVHSSVITDADIETAVIYEVNIRQYSAEGSFEAFTRDIPRLKNLGVRILWLMPIHPISMAKRKGALGSYYAVQDYGKINPEFGDLEDFRALVATAHANDMYVILDWVANHTGWDHPWVSDHPEFYTTNSEGEIIDPVDPATGESWGWTDVADLNFDNRQMREEMIQEMLYWVREENVDGFRCDVAHQVPVEFWNEAANRLREVKSVFMLAEAEAPELLEEAFDMQYAWEGHHLLNEIARGDKNASDLRHYLVELDQKLEDDDIVMNFTSNHDENTWSGTVFDRMGSAAEVMAVTTYVLPGMPLIYNGQEWDLDKRLRFFEKDTIPMGEEGRFYSLYEKLGHLKNKHPALNGGRSAADFHFLSTDRDKNVLALVRQKQDRRVVFLANMSDQPIEFTVEWDQGNQKDGNFQGYVDYFLGEEVELNQGAVYTLGPWAYQLLVDGVSP